MSSTTADGRARFEALWAELRLLLEWQQGFGLYLVFGDDERVTRELRQRLIDYTSFRARRLEIVRPETPDGAAREVLEAVFPATPVTTDAFAAPLWIELNTAPDDARWRRARRDVLAALNQRRSALEQAFGRPLLLHLPLTMGPEIVTWAPDLWSVRQLILLLPETPPAHPPTTDGAELHTLAQRIDDEAEQEAEAGHSEVALTRWRESVELKRRLRETLGDTPQTLRDLSVSLDRLGDAERERGRAEAAIEAYRESLDLRRQLRESLGDTPQTLRDLSVSLERLGDAERERGRAEAAIEAYRESLDLCRLMVAAFGDAFGAANAFRFMLGKVANVEQEIGDPQAGARLNAEWAALRNEPDA